MALLQKIYLDYAATTPVDPAVLRAMRPYFSEKFGNAGSLHSFGQEAMAALDKSREIVAASIGADFREIIFTGSATEANNLVLRGVVARSLIANRRLSTPRIIVSSIEHESVLETARDLEKEGIDVVYLLVDKTGLIDLKKLEASLDENTVLVSVMYANNEIGTIQQVAAIAKIISDFRSQSGAMPLFHTDASQAFQFLDCSVADLGVDLMTFSSHKIYGPKGAGALYLKDSGFRIQNSGGNKQKTPLNHESLFINHGFLGPLLTGGGQEFGLRSGTENIPAIVGFAKAVELLVNLNKLTSKDIANLRNELWCGIKKICPKAEINGVSPAEAPSAKRLAPLPNILNVYFPGREAQDLLTKFDLHGLAVSSGSACRARASLSSYVIEAMGYPKERSRSSVRFSLGRPTTKEEITQTLRIMKGIIIGNRGKRR
jgi:cysteine desulfurase